MGKPTDPHYWSKWRAAHPGYRDREHARLKARRQRMTPQERAADRGRPRPALRYEPVPSLHVGHDLFDEAKRHAAAAGIHPDRRDHVYDPYYEDTVSEVVVALLEGRDPASAIASHRSRHHAWRAHHVTGSDRTFVD